MTRGVEPAADLVSTKVVKRVSTVTGRKPTRLPPLYETIDPELLDAIVTSVSSDTSTLTLRFEFAGCQVTITGLGTVTVEESA